jgi:hypothetical protein
VSAENIQEIWENICILPNRNEIIGQGKNRKLDIVTKIESNCGDCILQQPGVKQCAVSDNSTTNCILPHLYLLYHSLLKAMYKFDLFHFSDV